MTDDVAESIAYCESMLRRIGIDPAGLQREAARLANLPDDEIGEALKRFNTAANEFFSAADSDYGALLLETLADQSPDPTRKRLLYEAAATRAAIFASGATSGSEGLARSVDVERITAKFERLAP